ncbi:acyl-CoA dehydratase activase [Clostridium magnum]|uniref:R-phenyllactate dehydratase activator n=1 Tax=Clostridium magnum DSM 2767 TaxID=1121326 RepID=A0A161W1L9_9CLOT|nr:acyl-CoA dehydratase activase [Clostridium magnum]KZL89070.1 R-phenyllactate dehydratase activator [Clostridium magnum DSM 2767]SHI29903.1 CoA-substrate-specific enzyme activase, putative [Clostridium magnum DSM 2767]
MFYIGIDIGSTASKVCIFENESIRETFVLPTGWSSVETANIIKNRLAELGIDEKNSKIVATGYGRVSVPYANKTITEITCHGKGAHYLLGEDCTVIDIGGQDTKVITVQKGNVTNFTMNDKCAAGTGRFLELMANTLGFSIEELCRKAQEGRETTISSMCTVFAESEVISLIGSGKKREDIAYGVVDSITSKVKSLCQKHSDSFSYFLSGGLSENPYIINKLSEKLSTTIKTDKLARYAGAIGAALMAKTIK